MRLGQGVPSPPVGKLRSCSNDLVTKQAVTDSPNWIPRKAILISHLSPIVPHFFKTVLEIRTQ